MRNQTRVSAHSATSGTVNSKIRQALDGHPHIPLFRWMPVIGQARKMTIAKFNNPGGAGVIRVPVRSEDTSGNSSGANVFFVDDEWTIDLDTSTINTSTFVGGLVDGILLAASTDYLTWAFFDPADSTEQFKGFGITARPHTTGATVTSGGGLGAAAVLRVATGHGWRFTIGSRVVCRLSTATGGVYNQGIITAHAASSLSLTMDASYAVANESNSALSDTLEVIQLDKFQPRMYNSDQVYQNYEFSYVGHIQTDASSNITEVRTRCDEYRTPTFYTFINKSGLTVDTEYNVCLARWLPFHARMLSAFIGSSVSSGSGRNRAQAAIKSGGIELISAETSTAGTKWSSGYVGVKAPDCSIYFKFDETSGTATGAAIGFAIGWIETEF